MRGAQLPGVAAQHQGPEPPGRASDGERRRLLEDEGTLRQFGIQPGSEEAAAPRRLPQIAAEAAFGAQRQAVAAGDRGGQLQAVLASAAGQLQAEVAQQARAVRRVDRRDAGFDAQGAVGRHGEVGDQSGVADHADAGPAELRRLQFAGQRRLPRRAAELQLAAQPAGQPVRRQVRCREVDGKMLARLTEGVARQQAVGTGAQLDVGLGDARPVDDHLALAGQRLPGQAAVVQREPGTHHGARLESPRWWRKRR